MQEVTNIKDNTKKYFYNDTTVNILGTEYEIIYSSKNEEEILEIKDYIGYCSIEDKKIVVSTLEEDDRYKFDNDNVKNKIIKETLRHEILHAFLFESGLNDSSLQPYLAWSKNEEMVDWFALQSPKIYKVYKELDLL